MKRKARKKTNLKTKSYSSKIKIIAQQFKKTIELRLGKIDWKKIGIYSLAILFVAAMSGVLGPKPQILSRALFKYAVLV